MTSRKTLERWETKVGNCEVTPEALWSIAKSLMKREGQNAPIAVHDPLRITYHPNELINVIADCLEKQFASYDLCDQNHDRTMETSVQTLLASVNGTTLGKVRTCDVRVN
jgi:hypothetical protein